MKRIKLLLLGLFISALSFAQVPLKHPWGVKIATDLVIDSVYESGGDTIISIDGNPFKLTDIGAGVGAVTSVGLSLPSQFTVSGSPVTATGTLTGVWGDTLANYIFAGPSSGGVAAPAFRSLVVGDMFTTLDAPLAITGTEVNKFSLSFSDASDRSTIFRFDPADGLSMRGYTGDDYTGDSGFVAVDSSVVTMAQYKGALAKSIKMDTVSSNGIAVRDDIGGRGMYYVADYSSVATSLWLSTKIYDDLHLGGRNVASNMFSPTASDHGSIVVWDSNGFATGVDSFKLEAFVPASSSAGVMLISCDTIHFSVTTVDTLLTLPEGTMIWDIQIWIETTFNGSGTNLLDVGVIGDGDQFQNDLDLAVASDMYGVANVAYRLPGSRYITCQYSDSGADASTGQAYICVHYSLH